jgi:hypothetical protein
MTRRTDKPNYISYEIIIKFVVVSIILSTVNGRKFRSLGWGTRRKKRLKEINIEGRIILKRISEKMRVFGKS